VHGKVYCAGFSVKKGFGTFVDSRARGLGFGVRVQGVGFRVHSIGFGGFGFRVHGREFWVPGFSFRGL
jgi:hypothetical protein